VCADYSHLVIIPAAEGSNMPIPAAFEPENVDTIISISHMARGHRAALGTLMASICTQVIANGKYTKWKRMQDGVRPTEAWLIVFRIDIFKNIY
jgi:hypothetical protein